MTGVELSYDIHDCAADPTQRLLLNVVISPVEAAIEAWSRWCAEVALDDVDAASYRLLPLAYRRLSALGVDDAVIARLKGVYRHTWIKNQTLFRTAASLIDLFAERGIPVLMLKGAVLSERFYADAGVRVMQDIDLMVPRDVYAEASALLCATGWAPFYASVDRIDWYVAHRFKHACGFRKAGVEIDLHADLLRFMPRATDIAWQTAQPFAWKERHTHSLCDTLQLFQTCIHGLRWSFGHLSWVVDAVSILRHPDAEIDWGLYVETARATQTTCCSANALAYLKAEFEPSIPQPVIDRLRATEVSRAEREEYVFQARRDWQSAGLRGNLRRTLYLSPRFAIARHGKQAGFERSMAAWLRYLFTPLQAVVRTSTSRA